MIECLYQIVFHVWRRRSQGRRQYIHGPLIGYSGKYSWYIYANGKRRMRVGQIVIKRSQYRTSVGYQSITGTSPDPPITQLLYEERHKASMLHPAGRQHRLGYHPVYRYR